MKTRTKIWMTIGAVSCLGLSSCTQTQIDDAKIQIAKLCAEILPLAQTAALIPGTPAIVASFAIVGCSASGQLKLQADPSSPEWLKDQKSKLQSLIKK